ncbi:FecR family protein [Algoriphagus zhangzhouensis]|uniref:FecR family protein n=1 Tax=Algoriphagus zhangzhouensis TaxID=1073327 RepID=A0A1M7ZEF3_9BACT|nr:FecR family protein [Algoriphagus zhangzhouensis]TDY46036.1 FecR family protein [Algoriphagus zhangzhouensis]SHO63270.1 FecR family protein [Algoriphagus zhangzhouensis]
MQNDKEYLDGLDESEKVALKSKLLKGIRKGIAKEDARKKTRESIWRTTKIAASFSLIILGLISVWVWTGKNEVNYRTSDNEILEISLPDSSTVILNSNSSLTYQTSRFSGFDRKVKLEGEAYFSIQKGNNGELFEINKESDLSVTVLGTQFSVKSSENLQKVILIEGSVKLDFHSEESSSEYLMTPGEAIRLTTGNNQLHSKKFEDPEILISWKSRKLKLKNQSLSEVLNTVAEIYDLKLDLEGISHDNNRVSGSLPLYDDPMEVFTNLEILFETPIELKGNQVNVKHSELN